MKTMWAETVRRPGACRPAATIACASIWLPSTTGRCELSPPVTLTYEQSPSGRTSRMSMRSAAVPHACAAPHREASSLTGLGDVEHERRRHAATGAHRRNRGATAAALQLVHERDDHAGARHRDGVT